MFFWWRKYEGSSLATAISCLGTILVTAISILLYPIININAPSVPEWILIIIVALAFIALKILLNKLTDKISKRVVNKVKTREQSIPVNYPLRIPASLTIVRDPSFAAALVPTGISLNGIKVATLKNGESATISIKMSHNILQTDSVGSKNVRYEFDVPDGAKGEIHVSGGIFRVRNVVWK